MFQLFNDRPELGSLVKTLRLVALSASNLNKLRGQVPEVEVMLKMIDSLFPKFKQLETLVSDFAGWPVFPFVEQVQGKQMPLSFLSNSLTRLHLFSSKEKRHISAKKATWLLCFTPLREAILDGVSFTVKDGDYLSGG